MRTAVVYVRLQAYDDVHTAYGRTQALAFISNAADRLCGHFGVRPVRAGHNELAFVVDGAVVDTDLATTTVQALADPVAVTAPLRVMADPTVGVARGPARRSAVLLDEARSAMVEALRDHTGVGVDYRGTFVADSAKALGQAVALEQSVADGSVHVVLQPGRRLQPGAPRWAEALLRFDDPDLAAVDVTDLIRGAERSGSIIPLGLQAVTAAARALGDLRRLGVTLDLLSVNLSPVQLRCADLAAQVEQAVTAAGESPSSFALELTETGAMGDFDRAQRQFEELRAHGFTIMIDDFGAGQSSLSRLVELPFDVLKIDRALLHKVHDDIGRRLVLGTSVSLALDLGRLVIVEGVESAEDAELLQDLGVHIGQGFHFGPPTRHDRAAFLSHPWDVWAPDPL